MSDTHVSVEVLLGEAQRREHLGANLPLGSHALAHLQACLHCQHHLAFLQAGVAAALEQELMQNAALEVPDALDVVQSSKPRPLDPSPGPTERRLALEHALVQWLCSATSPSLALEQRVSEPGGRLLAQRVALDLAELGVVDVDKRLAILGISLKVQKELAPKIVSSPQPPLRPPWARMHSWARPLRAMLSPLILPGILVLMGLAVVTGVWPLPLNQIPSPIFTLRGSPEPSVGSGVVNAQPRTLQVAASLFRASGDGLWDLVPPEGNELLSCRIGDRLELLVTGTGSGLLSLWVQPHGGTLLGPLALRPATLNTARLKLLPDGEHETALGMRLDGWTTRLVVYVAFSEAPPPRFFRLRWLEAPRSEARDLVVRQVRCTQSAPLPK